MDLSLLFWCGPLKLLVLAVKPNVSSFFIYILFIYFIQALNPHQLSLPLKFWDTVLGQYRTLELHCPSTVTPSPHTTTTTHTRPPTPPKPHVFCSARHMRVELPPGPISGIVVKGKCVSVGMVCVSGVYGCHPCMSWILTWLRGPTLFFFLQLIGVGGKMCWFVQYHTLFHQNCSLGLNANNGFVRPNMGLFIFKMS